MAPPNRPTRESAEKQHCYTEKERARVRNLRVCKMIALQNMRLWPTRTCENFMHPNRERQAQVRVTVYVPLCAASGRTQNCSQGWHEITQQSYELISSLRLAVPNEGERYNVTKEQFHKPPLNGACPTRVQ